MQLFFDQLGKGRERERERKNSCQKMKIQTKRWLKWHVRKAFAFDTAAKIVFMEGGEDSRLQFVYVCLPHPVCRVCSGRYLRLPEHSFIYFNLLGKLSERRKEAKCGAENIP
jgi:hypothetical protein